MGHALIAKVAVTIAAGLGAGASQPPFPPPADAVIHAAPCPVGGGACSIGRDVYVPANESLRRFTLWHELGHVRDLHLTDADHGYMLSLMGFRAGAVWMSGTYRQGGTTSPSEWFADYHAACALRLTLRNWIDDYAPWPGRARYSRICRAITDIARIRG